MSYIRPARFRDVAYIGERMRTRDAAEVRAARGLEPTEALRDALSASAVAWTLCSRFGDPVMMFGAAPLSLDGYGAPWALATDDFKRNVRFILENTPRYIRKMHSEFPVLVNFEDVRNADSIRYLRWAGFTFTAYDPEFGKERRPFLQFTRTRHV